MSTEILEITKLFGTESGVFIENLESMARTVSTNAIKPKVNEFSKFTLWVYIRQREW